MQADRPRDLRGIAAWCLYDWANSAFNTVIGTFVFSVYFARGVYGDETAGSAVWAYALAAAGFAIVLLSPVLGAVADRVGRRKPWLAAFTLLTVLPTAMLWWAMPTPDAVVYTLACVILSTIAFELGVVFYNAMLPGVAPRGMIGRVSGWGWGVGYFGGLACLAVALVGFVQTDTPWFGVGKEAAAHIRATAPLVAVWMAVFALPLFLFTRDEPSTGIGLGQAMRQGLRQLAATARDVRHYANILRYLIASAIYRDGMNTLFAVGGLYAAGVFGMDFAEIMIFAIALNVTAGLGSVAFAWIDDWIGSKRTIVVSLIGTIATGLPILLIEDKGWFFALAVILGIFVGPVQAASRSMMARLAPDAIRTEMFGLYALSGKAVAFLGPLCYGLATDAFATQRAGMATVLAFFAIGLIGLYWVKEERA
ncbi:MAG: MFS transporter [Alphaproteobacteria bacterium]